MGNTLKIKNRYGFKFFEVRSGDILADYTGRERSIVIIEVAHGAKNEPQWVVLYSHDLSPTWELAEICKMNFNFVFNESDLNDLFSLLRNKGIQYNPTGCNILDRP